jgi:hypothetical protein
VTKECFKRQWLLLQAAFPSSWPSDIQIARMDLYYQRFSDCDDKSFQAAVTWAIDHENYFPTVAILKSYIPRKSTPCQQIQPEKSLSWEEGLNKIKEMTDKLREKWRPKEEKEKIKDGIIDRVIDSALIRH